MATATVSFWPDPVSKRIGVATPYNADFVTKAKMIGGKWDGTAKRWTFPLEHEAQVRALCMEIYGTCDGAAKPSREALEARMAEHLAAVVQIQEELDKLDATEGAA